MDYKPSEIEEQAFWQSYSERRRLSALGLASPIDGSEQAQQARLQPLARLSSRPQVSLSTPHTITVPRVWGGTLNVYSTGTLAQVKIDDSYKQAGDGFSPYRERDETPASLVNDWADRDSGRGGKRGRVIGFSSDSRRRLLRECAKIDKAYLPVMFTLTFADDEWAADPDEWKQKHLRNFQMKMNRKLGDFPALWRLELKPRQTGDKVGQVAPHFHLICWLQVESRKKKITYPELLKLRAWTDEAWGKGRTRVESIRSARGTMAYIGKYICKPDTDDILSAYPEGVGRVWGRWGVDVSVKDESGNVVQGEKVNLFDAITSPIVTIQLTYLEAMALMRYAKRKVFVERGRRVIDTETGEITHVNGLTIRDDIGLPSLYMFIDDPMGLIDCLDIILQMEFDSWEKGEKLWGNSNVPILH